MSGSTVATESSHDGNRELIACHQCDLLAEIEDLAEGCKAECARCGELLCVEPKGGVMRPLAFGLAALAMFGLSNSFPFLTLKEGGREQVMNLFQSALEIFSLGNHILSLLVIGFVIVLPAAILLGALYLLVPLAFERRLQDFAFWARFVFSLGPWAMVDVYLLGVLVSLTKILSLATVEIGFSFWAYVGFVVLFAATLSCLDKRMIWRRWEALS